MKPIMLIRHIIFLFILFGLAVGGTAVALEIDEETYWNNNVQPLPANVTHYTFTSSFLKAPYNVVGLNVYTPPGYEASGNTRRYPVIYLLHGVNGSEANYFSWYSSFSTSTARKVCSA